MTSSHTSDYFFNTEGDKRAWDSLNSQQQEDWREYSTTGEKVPLPTDLPDISNLPRGHLELGIIVWYEAFKKMYLGRKRPHHASLKPHLLPAEQEYDERPELDWIPDEVTLRRWIGDQTKTPVLVETVKGWARLTCKDAWIKRHEHPRYVQKLVRGVPERRSKTLEVNNERSHTLASQSSERSNQSGAVPSPQHSSDNEEWTTQPVERDSTWYHWQGELNKQDSTARSLKKVLKSKRSYTRYKAFLRSHVAPLDQYGLRRERRRKKLKDMRSGGNLPPRSD